MKLQKLVYYAQVRSLVIDGTPLFSNRIEAWANGPVSPDLFHVHSGKYMVGQGGLESFGSSSTARPQRKLPIQPSRLFENNYSGEQLREMTHREAPWTDARKGYKPGERCETEIAVDAMRNYYSSPICLNPIAH